MEQEERVFQNISVPVMKGLVEEVAELTHQKIDGFGASTAAVWGRLKFKGDTMLMGMDRRFGTMGGTGGKIVVTQSGQGSKVCIAWEKHNKKCEGVTKYLWENLETVEKPGAFEVVSQSSTEKAQVRLKALEGVGLFKRPDYVPFMLGVFVIGGLLAAPLIWGSITHLGYLAALPWSIVSCVVFLVSIRRNGIISWHIALIAIALAFVAAIIYSTVTGKPSFIAGGILGFIVLAVSGYLGIGIRRLTTRQRK